MREGQRQDGKIDRRDVTELVNDLSVVIWEADPKTFAFLYVSGGAEQLLGYPVEQWLAEPTFWADHIHPEDRNDAVALCAAATAQGMDHDFDYRMIAIDGTVRWVRDLVRVRRDEMGRVTRLSGLIVDETRTRAAHEAMRASEHRFRTVFESASAGVVLISLEGDILLANDAASSRSGYAPDELRRLNIAKLVHAEEHERTAEILGGFREGSHTSFRYESRYVHGAGHSVNVLVSTALAHDISGKPFVIVQLHDVTERDRLKQQLLQAQKLEAIGRLAAGIAHDFNNVLTVIAVYADLLVDEMDDTDARLSDAVEIRKAANTGAAITRQLLAFGRTMPGDPRIVGVNSVVSDVLRLLRRTLGSRIVVSATLSPEPLTVRMDSTQLEQVIMNLALNARDAMPMGGTLSLATSRVDVESGFHGASTPGEYVRLTVTDTGVGMDAATRARIFEPFFTTKAPEKGTGLGLSTVYRIVQQQGGFILVDSAPGRGTRFELYLRALMGQPPAGV